LTDGESYANLLIESFFSQRRLAVTVQDYRIRLGWSATELAKRTGLSARTIARVEKGVPVYAHTLGAIARVLGEATGKEIDIRDLDGVKITER
jgi:transcriptional regulator with XRE-family HTH domain